MLKNLSGEQFAMIIIVAGFVISIIKANWWAVFAWLVSLVLGLTFLGVV